MPIVNAYSDYDNYLLIIEDVYVAGGQYVITGLDTTVYALANYPHWQVLTLSTNYAADTYSLSRVSASATIRLTRPLALMETTTINTFLNGVFRDSVRYPFYNHISDAFIKPEDGIESTSDFTENPNSVEDDGNCNG